MMKDLPAKGDTGHPDDEWPDLVKEGPGIGTDVPRDGHAGQVEEAYGDDGQATEEQEGRVVAQLNQPINRILQVIRWLTTRRMTEKWRSNGDVSNHHQ